MTNNIGNLEAKTVYIVDSFNKRKIKKSTPTLLLGVLEKFPKSTLKEIENKAVSNRNKSLISNFNSANTIRKVKGYSLYPNLRAYVNARLRAIIRYYTNKEVINNTFNGLFPIVKEEVSGKDRYTLNKITV